MHRNNHPGLPAWARACLAAAALLVIYVTSTALVASGVTRQVFGDFDTLARKAAHVSLYAGLFLVFRYAVRGMLPRRGFLCQDALAAAGALAAACLDEWHQSFVPERSGSVVDVIWDSLGIALGIALATIHSERQKRRSQKAP